MTLMSINGDPYTSYSMYRTDLRIFAITFLKAYSHPYIFITLIPKIISFMILTRLSVFFADACLQAYGHITYV